MERAYSGQLRKSGNKLVHVKTGDKISFEAFVKNLEEGTLLDVFMEVAEGNGTLGQLAKAHKCIRILANRSGENFEDMKFFIKDKSGLVVKRTALGREYLDWKSFGDCSFDELNLVIQACVDIGREQFGINLA